MLQHCLQPSRPGRSRPRSAGWASLSPSCCASRRCLSFRDRMLSRVGDALARLEPRLRAGRGSPRRRPDPHPWLPAARRGGSEGGAGAAPALRTPGVAAQSSARGGRRRRARSWSETAPRPRAGRDRKRAAGRAAAGSRRAKLEQPLVSKICLAGRAHRPPMSPAAPLHRV